MLGSVASHRMIAVTITTHYNKTTKNIKMSRTSQLSYIVSNQAHLISKIDKGQRIKKTTGIIRYFLGDPYV